MAKIPNSPDEILDDFVEDYQRVFGPELRAVVLYGSAARGGYVPGVSDINFLVVLSQNGIQSLDQAIDLVAEWRKRNVAVPLFLTRRYIESSLDTFPIEFLNMQRHHRLVFGEDILKDLIIEKSDLRLQLERELRGKLLHLREALLRTGNDRETLREMLATSVPTFAAIFQGLLHFQDKPIPESRAEVFENVAQGFDLDNRVFAQLLNIKKGEWKGSRQQLIDLTKLYIAQIKRLVEAVDQL